MVHQSISVSQAHELVDKIVRDNGFVKESTLERMSPSDRREVEEALLAKDKKIGASVLTLAKNLYTSNARFVFELLQNADDNEYSQGQEPFISFHVYHDSIKIECNEDGFTGPNLRAICDIGNSSKTSSQGYIGEKGIGFKSVFMAAAKVHIQSGPFSFSFVHRKGDSGMGMVRPIWEESTAVLPNPLTRMTLDLHKSQDPAVAQDSLKNIRKQFRDIRPAVLLFLRRIQRIDISFYDKGGVLEWSSSNTMGSSVQAHCSLVKSCITDHLDSSKSETRQWKYHVTRYMATNLAKSENRMLAPAEEASASYSQSEVVLAFPLSEQSLPILEPQNVFAFLPLRQMGFNFLIQADFVTQANREDIVTTSRRNIGLRSAIVSAVIKAVLQFCQHSSLQYTWMRFIPQKDTHHWDPFWITLVDQVRAGLRTEQVLRSREKGHLCCIEKMRDRASNYNDQHGDPLFKDLEPEQYLSSNYTLPDIQILRHLGLMQIGSYNLVHKFLREDTLSSDSRWRNPPDSDWDDRASRLLKRCGKRSSDSLLMLKGLDIIQLNDGSWSSVFGGKLFFENIGKIPIPTDLGLRLVKQDTSECGLSRQDFFEYLGVKTATVNRVQTAIMEKYYGKKPSLSASREHLQFLYLTYQTEDTESIIIRPALFIYDGSMKARRPGLEDTYVETDELYGPLQLLGHQGIQACNLSFVNSYYMQDPPDRPEKDITWVEWMYEYLRLRRYLRLVNREGTSLSTEATYLSLNHPSKFLGFLKHTWSFESDLVLQKESIVAELKNTDVLCVDETTFPLDCCALPLTELSNFCQNYMIVENFPFLQIEAVSNDNELQTDWAFLSAELGVIARNDIRFRLAMLEHAILDEVVTLKQLRQLSNLHQLIHAYALEAQDPKIVDLIRSRFEEEGLISAPNYDSEWACWIAPSECLWEAPRDLQSKRPLKAMWTSALVGTDVEIGPTQNLFQKTLGIRDISVQDVFAELKDLRDDEQANSTLVLELYEILQKAFEEDPDIDDELSERFEEDGLVYLDGATVNWYQPSRCIWSNEINIDDKVAIDGQYPGLKSLFTEALGVETLTFDTIHRSLLEAKDPTVERIKELLRKFNSFLPSTKRPSEFLKRKLLPVRFPDGRLELCTDKVEFFINDREETYNIFHDRVKLLDFSHQEICKLRPFIEWANLESRYLSRCVGVISQVDSGAEMPIGDTNRDLKMKAHALLRIASKYNSPRVSADPVALYNLLSRACTLATNGISSSISLSQDGHTHTHELERSELHIEQADSLLKVYVPRDTTMQEVCFYNALPYRLMSWLITPPGADTTARAPEDAVVVLQSVLNCNLSAVSPILTNQGVPELDIPGLPNETADQQDVVEQVVLSTVARSSSLMRGDEMSSRVAYTPSHTTASYEAESVRSTTPPLMIREPGLDPQTREADILGQNRTQYDVFEMQYRRLLQRIVRQANHSRFRPLRQADISEGFHNLSLGEDTPDRSTPVQYSNEWERRVKIGAAGELFVYKLLTGLPHFDFDNWLSVIRHHCSAHPDYSSLTRFTGIETSDIVYEDSLGVLTEWLIEGGHLPESRWAGKKPQYFIEVKTTMEDCGHAFFVSDGQYERMQNTTNGPLSTGQENEIYVVFRVYNLGRADIGLAIYVDPAEQRRLGRLRFITDKYAVFPVG